MFISKVGCVVVQLLYPAWATYTCARQYEKEYAEYEDLVNYQSTYQKLKEKVKKRTNSNMDSLLSSTSNDSSVDVETRNRLDTWENKRKKEHLTFHKKWLSYWIVYLVLFLFEYMFESFAASRFVLYFEAKLLFVCYLVFSHVCEAIFDRLLVSVLGSKGVEDEIDKQLAVLQKELYQHVFTYMIYAKDHALVGLMNAAQFMKNVSNNTTPAANDKSE